MRLETQAEKQRVENDPARCMLRSCCILMRWFRSASVAAVKSAGLVKQQGRGTPSC